MSTDELGHFLRSRRAQLVPDITRSRQRTRGLRREDVAELAAMSPDYYRRLEQGRIGPPSAQILESLSRALQLTQDEQDYLYRVADRACVRRVQTEPATEVAAPLRQLVESLGGTPAQVMTTDGETLLQNPAAVALLGDHSGYTGDARYSTYRWFTDPAGRWMHPPEECEEEGRARVADLRARSVETGSAVADRLIGLLRDRSPEFERMWREQKVALCRGGTKTLVNPRFGTAELQCQILRHEGAAQLLITYTAAVGSVAAGQLRQLTDPQWA
ncbi:helix-turn-helix transcriptional regulator [Asanoa siamensis]|uniref:helix-turn-helix transcriptional regulator n=1 Tax=Asanoa siamensis TaxID=926357 RepID=UPI0019411E5E|nr:helix-turn-helix transcriptional regulator [Asanoa siamensis]